MIWPMVSGFDVVADPFAELHRMNREMNRLLNGGGRQPGVYPALNVWTKDDAAQVVASVPGLKPEELSITVEERILCIEGERKPGAVEGEHLRQERFLGRFSRQVRLPFEVEADRVTAKYERGLVLITLPRREDSKPRKIAVQAG